MKAKIIIIIIALLSIGLNGCGKKYTKSETSEYKINTSNKRKISLENINGNIMISQGSDSSQLFVKAIKEIKVKKKYLNTPFDEIEIDLDTNREVITIKSEINEKGSDDIFKFDFNRKQKVDYEIYLPPNIEIKIENTNGKVMSSGIKNDLIISLTNGDVDLNKYTGKLECEITNGDFSGYFDSTAGIDINTVNGNVTIFLNNYMNANVKAETLNGKIVDENLQLRDLMRVKKLLRGKLGNINSDVDIEVETVNGKIRLYGRNEI